MRHKFLILLLALVLLGAVGAYFYVHHNQAEDTEAAEVPQVFETVTFGSYHDVPISWYVLSREDGQMLLLSAEILDYQPYNTERTDITWSESSIRSWLNSTFLMEAFTAEEQARLL